MRFLLTLIESGVEILFADLPDVSGAMGKFILTQMAAVAELEAGLVSERTKAALKAAHAARDAWRDGRRDLGAEMEVGARARAVELAPVIRDLQAKGYRLRGMAAELTKRESEDAARAPRLLSVRPLAFACVPMCALF